MFLLGIVFVARHKDADAPHTLALLGQRHYGPRCRTKPSDELPPLH
jgi:hypothetical protein